MLIRASACTLYKYYSFNQCFYHSSIVVIFQDIIIFHWIDGYNIHYRKSGKQIACPLSSNRRNGLNARQLLLFLRLRQHRACFFNVSMGLTQSRFNLGYTNTTNTISQTFKEPTATYQPSGNATALYDRRDGGLKLTSSHNKII